MPSESAIVVRGTQEQLTQAQKVISELDRPKKAYRLTYTITESDGAKRVGTNTSPWSRLRDRERC